MPKRKRDGRGDDDEDDNGTDATHARLDTFARGMIWGMHLAGAPREDILQEVSKKDGTLATLSAVDKVIATMKANPEWRGQDSSAGGRPGKLTAKQKKDLRDLVFKERGKAKVSIPYCKRRLRFLRKVSRQTVVRALHDAGLAWLRRREKNIVPKEHRAARLAYSDWILKRRQSTLNRFAYTDGTTFYLAWGASGARGKIKGGPWQIRVANG